MCHPPKERLRLNTELDDLRRLEPLSNTATVANFFIARVEDLTQMKLQKLVFFAHGWCLAIHGRRLIDEEIQAWQYGPVIASLYHELKGYGSDAIPQHERIPGGDPELPADVRQLLKRVLAAYGEYDAITLSKMTHLPGAPWEDAYDGSRYSTISDTSIGEYFRSQQ